MPKTIFTVLFVLLLFTPSAAHAQSDLPRLVYLDTVDRLDVCHLVLTDAQGTFHRTLTRSFSGVDRLLWSPDGQRIAFSAEGDVWITDLNGQMTQVSTDGYTPNHCYTPPFFSGADWAASWSPKGRWLLYQKQTYCYSTAQPLEYEKWIYDTMSGETRVMPANAAWSGELWITDTSFVLGGTVYDLSTGIQQHLFGPYCSASNTVRSPDQQWLAYACNASANFHQIGVVSFKNPAQEYVLLYETPFSLAKEFMYTGRVTWNGHHVLYTDAAIEQWYMCTAPYFDDCAPTAEPGENIRFERARFSPDGVWRFEWKDSALSTRNLLTSQAFEITLTGRSAAWQPSPQ